MHMYNVMYLHVHVHGNNVNATKIYNYTSYLSKADLFASIQPWRACWRQWVVGHGLDDTGGGPVLALALALMLLEALGRGGVVKAGRL